MNFRDLKVYQLTLVFIDIAEKLGGSLGKGHQEVRSQIRRASLSIPLNIAEASGRTGQKDRSYHLSVARGSAMECAALNDVCRRLGGVDLQIIEEGDALLLQIVRMLSKMCL